VVKEFLPLLTKLSFNFKKILSEDKNQENRKAKKVSFFEDTLPF
jgi:hypothetical protein